MKLSPAGAGTGTQLGKKKNPTNEKSRIFNCKSDLVSFMQYLRKSSQPCPVSLPPELFPTLSPTQLPSAWIKVEDMTGRLVDTSHPHGGGSKGIRRDATTIIIFTKQRWPTKISNLNIQLLSISTVGMLKLKSSIAQELKSWIVAGKLYFLEDKQIKCLVLEEIFTKYLSIMLLPIPPAKVILWFKSTF